VRESGHSLSAETHVGLVGCGRLFERGYLPALESTPGLRLVAVADRDEARARRLVDCPVFGSAEDLLERVSVQLLVVATPAAAHAANARVAAEHGVLALVEKPPAADSEQAAALAALDPAPAVGFNRRFEPCYRSARAATEGIADLRVDLRFSTRPAAWDAYEASDGPLPDLGTHVVDLAGWITGRRITSVAVEEATPLRWVFAAELENAKARLEVSHSSRWRERLRIEDGHGRPVGRGDAGGVMRAAIARLLPWRPPPLVRSLAAQLQAAALRVAGTPDTDLATAVEGHRVMQVLDAVRLSAERGGTPCMVDDSGAL
jgi:predicted dehydrogenase